MKTIKKPTINTPLELFKNFPLAVQRDVVSPAAINMVKKGCPIAAGFIANHPKAVVYLDWARAFRFSGEGCDGYCTSQAIQFAFGIGINNGEDIEDDDEDGDHVWFRVDVESNDDLVIKWEDWVFEEGCKNPQEIIAILLGDWIKGNWKLKPMGLDGSAYVLGDSN